MMKIQSIAGFLRQSFSRKRTRKFYIPRPHGHSTKKKSAWIINKMCILISQDFLELAFFLVEVIRGSFKKFLEFAGIIHRNCYCE